MSKPHSIRRQLLKWLLIPMLLLLILDSTTLYHFANKLETETYDHGLLTAAKDIEQYLEKFNAYELVALDANTEKAILSDTRDSVYYSIKNELGQTLIGEPAIQFADDLQNKFVKENTVYYFSELNHQKIRVVSMPKIITVGGKQLNIYIQVAETLNQRNAVRQQILAWILVPQLMLLVVAGILLLIGIKRGLTPLWEVNNELAKLSKLSYSDLQPIKMNNIPEEIARLVNSINELMAKLNHAILSQNRFIADAAHQLRTPLAGTRAQIELAQQSQSLPDIKNRLHKVSISTERLIHLINQLLILAKNQPEAIHQISFENTDLVAFVQRVICEFELEASAKDIALTYIGSEEEIIIVSEESGLHNLIYNLIDNAIRYTPQGGKVTLDVESQPYGAYLIIEDNGIGIPEIEQALVFERFYRGNQATAFGTGLGLSIVKEIVELHKATITIESHVHVGTKISVFFQS